MIDFEFLGEREIKAAKNPVLVNSMRERAIYGNRVAGHFREIIRPGRKISRPNAERRHVVEKESIQMVGIENYDHVRLHRS